MTYEQTLDYLYSKLPMFHRVGPAAYKEDLYNTIALCKVLGNPENNFRSIHIAGTNGKGSVSHMLASILQDAGYKTGLYTSPHLVDFRERIRINGQMIEKEHITGFVTKHSALIDRIEPSFFEVTVALAFDYFSENKVDIAVIETGLGGRLDSTNVINPILSVITNISFDHQNLLGYTLPEIASEKAGIIKKNTPAVIGRHNPETDDVFLNKASKENSNIYFGEDEWKVVSHNVENGILYVTFEKNRDSNKRIKLHTPLAGNYQLENIATVLTASELLSDNILKITKDNIVSGLRKVVTNTGLRGRWEVLKTSPLVICDVAHNEAGLKAVFEQVLSIPHEKLHIVYGMVKDKDLTKALSRLPTKAEYYFCRPDIPRALDVNELYENAVIAGLNGSPCPSVEAAFDSALNHARDNDIVLVTGSFFVVSEILESHQASIISRQP